MKGTRQPFTSSNLMGPDDGFGFGSGLTVVFFDFFFPLDFLVVEERKRWSAHSGGSFNSPPK